MRIGMCGAHRSGKTTLAAYASKKYSLPMVQSPASAIIKEFGFDMARDNRLMFENSSLISNNTGVSMQWSIYLSLVRQLEEAGSNFVADRTPIDVAAYMLADATAYAGEEWSQYEAVRMVEKAIVDTQRLFDAVILVPPGIQFVVEDGKPPINAAYQEHHHMICRGILLDDDLDLWWDEIRRHTTKLSDRTKFVDETIQTLVADGLKLAA